MYQKSESELLHQLTAIEPDCRVVFAAACAERLLPIYQVFCERTAEEGKYQDARAILNCLWDDLAGNLLDDSAIAELDGQSERLMPDDSAASEELVAYAQNAIAAVIYSLQCRASGEKLAPVGFLAEVGVQIGHIWPI